MFIEIDVTSSQPIFEQVADQIRFAIAAGAVHSQEMVPSVRELSKELMINPNTVARAYRLLQDEGILILLRGRGLVVDMQSQEKCVSHRNRFFRDKFQSFLDEAKRSRLSDEEVIEIIRSKLTF